MNATQTHFVTVCPNCSTGLKVRRVYLGQQVVCKQCSETFLGEEGNGQSTIGFGEGGAGAPFPTSPHEERILVNCPSCQAALKVRRRYVGNHVICKECERTFLVSPPEDTSADSNGVGPRSTPSTDLHHRNGECEQPGTGVASETIHLEYERLLAENQRHHAEHEQLQFAHRELQTDLARIVCENQQTLTEYDELQVEHGRMKISSERIQGQLNRTTSELESIRAELGGLAPAKVRSLADECSSLHAEVERRRNELETLRNEQSAADRAVAVREHQRNADLEAARAEIDRLAGLLLQRDTDRDAAIAEKDRLEIDRQEAVLEVERLRTTLDEPRVGHPGRERSTPSRGGSAARRGGATPLGD